MKKQIFLKYIMVHNFRTDATLPRTPQFFGDSGGRWGGGGVPLAKPAGFADAGSVVMSGLQAIDPTDAIKNIPSSIVGALFGDYGALTDSEQRAEGLMNRIHQKMMNNQRRQWELKQAAQGHFGDDGGIFGRLLEQKGWDIPHMMQQPACASLYGCGRGAAAGAVRLPQNALRGVFGDEGGKFGRIPRPPSLRGVFGDEGGKSTGIGKALGGFIKGEIKRGHEDAEKIKKAVIQPKVESIIDQQLKSSGLTGGFRDWMRWGDNGGVHQLANHIPYGGPPPYVMGGFHR